MHIHRETQRLSLWGTKPNVATEAATDFVFVMIMDKSSSLSNTVKCRYNAV